ncbi:dentin sialophosphoprotein-like [Hordeum vulgare]|nr:dentin sialophosphoprotein-like [Hordeum vulgare]
MVQLELVDQLMQFLCARIKSLMGLRSILARPLTKIALDSSLGSPWASVGSQDGSSGFDSDGAESSSPDASMTDIAPVLDEIDPLLGADFTRPDPIPNDDSDSDSHVSSQDHETDDDSNDDDDGNNDTKDGGEENKKGEGQEAAFIWTADDAKNLMDLGYSEMERNRRLEILMVRRRSRKNIVFEIDNNLTDANGKNVDDLSRFGAQVSHISVTRRNPFDLPYDSDEAAIPGSAPSILHARKNPFDFLEHSSEIGVSAHDNLSPGNHHQLLIVTSSEDTRASTLELQMLRRRDVCLD